MQKHVERISEVVEAMSTERERAAEENARVENVQAEWNLLSQTLNMLFFYAFLVCSVCTALGIFLQVYF